MKYCYDNPEKCTVTESMQFIGGRWKMIILYLLMAKSMRFGIIKAYIPSISNKVLSQQLKELESDGLIIREQVPSSDKFIYILTETGNELRKVIHELEVWGSKRLRLQA